MPSGVYKHKSNQGFQNGNSGFVTEIHKRNMSKALKGKPKPCQQGENSHFWKDGRCQNKDYISWIKNKRNRMPKIGGHTFGEWENLKMQYNRICPSCHKSEPEIKLTQDHIIPLSKGGSDNIENIQPLCQSCNSKKHTKIIEY